ncbi:hypothetical protein AB0I77_06000 [Streptomyces sp. NPDC050619]|uniref:hypothetical protein n=1 Tax=Streptomyces sp. NPDC050619 TaxID=3157214 RepID=UPI0034484589
MRSARILLATAAASAVLGITAPGVYAAAGDWDQDDSSYSKEHDKGDDSSYSKEHDKGDDSSYSKEHDKGDDSSYGKEHDKGDKHDAPRGGMHTGGGALAAVKADDQGSTRDPKHDPETYKDNEYGKDSSWTKDDEHGKDSSWSKDKEDSWSGGHSKPSGGMHTGGGGLASPTATAGGLAVLAVAGTGLYAARRRMSAHGTA